MDHQVYAKASLALSLVSLGVSVASFAYSISTNGKSIPPPQKPPVHSDTADSGACDADPDDMNLWDSGPPLTVPHPNQAAVVGSCLEAVQKALPTERPRLYDQLGVAYDAAGLLAETSGRNDEAEMDADKARASYFESAKGKYASGMAHYAMLLLAQKDDDDAIPLFSQAKNGSMLAAYKWADFSWTGFRGGLVKSDCAEAKALIVRLSEMGYAPAKDHYLYTHSCPHSN